MKFRYYITSLPDGEILGTNTEEVAENFAMSCDYFVVDTETNQWIMEGGDRQDVREAE